MPKAATAITILAFLGGAAPAMAAGSGEFVLRETTLPPVAHTIFCTNYPRECGRSEASASFLITDQKLLYAELDWVNRRVNAAILPSPAKASGVFSDRWLLFPTTGNCNDYVVSKRHELMARGWPSSALLLAEVALKTGEHHLILVASAGGASYILDNLRPEIVPLTSSVGYRWIRIESPQAPEMWVRMGLNN